MIVSIVLIICTTATILAVTFRPKCRHVWDKVDESGIIQTFKGKVPSLDRTYEQTIHHYSCKMCGQLVRVNMTSGENKVLVPGGSPANDHINIK